MAKDAIKTEKPQEAPEQKVLREFQKLTDNKERKAFYEAHPELKQIYSSGNFH